MTPSTLSKTIVVRVYYMCRWVLHSLPIHTTPIITGIALPSGVSPPPSMWRLLLSLRLTNALPPFLQHDKVSADDDSHESSSDKEGDAKCKTEPVPATKQVPMVKQRKYRKRSKWTRLKGAHRKPAPEATTALLSNNAASAHGVGKRGAFGFPQRLLDAAEHNAAVAKGLRLRLHSEVPPFVLVVPAGRSGDSDINMMIPTCTNVHAKTFLTQQRPCAKWFPRHRMFWQPCIHCFNMQH